MDEPVAHIYVHIPFCPVKCPYCAFVTHVGSLKLMEPYLDALVAEAAALRRDRPGGPLRTIYFGGGTPSLMTPRQLVRLLDRLDGLFGRAEDCEVTLEAHPGTVGPTELAGFAAAGVTRLSFGGESLQVRELEHLGRTHSGDRVVELVSLAEGAGFASVSVDLMYGVPAQTLHSWDATLRRILSVRPHHLSLYPLQVEPRTVYGLRKRRRQLQTPEDEVVAEMYALACARLRAAGYEHYEVASWALEGHRCRHNLAYWQNREFYAVGVGAHGYLKPYRTENVRGTKRYIEMVAEGRSPLAERTSIGRREELTETVMLGLRLLRDGLDLDGVSRRFGVDLRKRFAADLQELMTRNLVSLESGRLTLAESAVPIANEIWERLIP